MGFIGSQKQWQIEEYFLALAVRNLAFLPVLIAVSVAPFKAGDKRKAEIEQACKETDPSRRIQLYRDIEEKFFGKDGEFPFMPIFLRIVYQAEHSWLSRTPALFGGEQWYNYYIDVDKQTESRGS